MQPIIFSLRSEYFKNANVISAAISKLINPYNGVSCFCMEKYFQASHVVPLSLPESKIDNATKYDHTTRAMATFITFLVVISIK